MGILNVCREGGESRWQQLLQARIWEEGDMQEESKTGSFPDMALTSAASSELGLLPSCAVSLSVWRPSSSGSCTCATG